MSTNSKPTIAEATLRLDKPRRLRMDFNALALIEEETGVNLLQQGHWSEIVKNMGYSRLRYIIWALARSTDTSVRLETIGQFLGPQMVGPALDVVTDLLERSRPPAETGEGRPDRPDPLDEEPESKPEIAAVSG